MHFGSPKSGYGRGNKHIDLNEEKAETHRLPVVKGQGMLFIEHSKQTSGHSKADEETPLGFKSQRCLLLWLGLLGTKSWNKSEHASSRKQGEVLILDKSKTTGFKSDIFTREKLFIYIFRQEMSMCAPQLAVPMSQHCPAPQNQVR